MKESEEIKTYVYIQHIDTDISVVIARGKRSCGQAGGWGEMGTERAFAWGGGHMMQCADDVLVNYVLETCMIL